MSIQKLKEQYETLVAALANKSDENDKVAAQAITGITDALCDITKDTCLPSLQDEYDLAMSDPELTRGRRLSSMIRLAGSGIELIENGTTYAEDPYLQHTWLVVRMVRIAKFMGVESALSPKLIRTSA